MKIRHFNQLPGPQLLICSSFCSHSAVCARYGNGCSGVPQSACEIQTGKDEPPPPPPALFSVREDTTTQLGTALPLFAKAKILSCNKFIVFIFHDKIGNTLYACNACCTCCTCSACYAG